MCGDHLRLRRRDVLAGATAAAALFVKPSLVRGSEANSAISIGLIGAGDRGSAHVKQLGNLAERQQVKVTAVCDVWQTNLRRTAERVTRAFGSPPRVFTRFGELIADRSVDAVIIATPDYAHTAILIEALAAGKDAYVEKPMSIDLGEANRALDLARANERVVQVGTQGTLDLGANYATPTDLTVVSEAGVSGDGAAASKIQPDRGADHMANWLTCLRTRERPNADIQFGHQHAVATIMAATALETGRRQKYDPEKQEIVAG